MSRFVACRSIDDRPNVSSDMSMIYPKRRLSRDHSELSQFEPSAVAEKKMNWWGTNTEPT